MSDDHSKPLQENLGKKINLTLAQGIVKTEVAPAPLAGYIVVVFEKMGGGAKWVAELKPEDRPLNEKKSLFSPRVSYACYAVSSDPKLTFDINCQLTLSVQYQFVILSGTAYYYISSPLRLVLALENDPLGRIRTEIEKRIQKNIFQSNLNIRKIQDQLMGIKDIIMPYDTLNDLNEFAAGFGICLKNIDVSCQIPDKYLEPGKKMDDALLAQEMENSEVILKGIQFKNQKAQLNANEELREITRGHEIRESHHENEKQDVASCGEKNRFFDKMEMENLNRSLAIKQEMINAITAKIKEADFENVSPGSLVKDLDTILKIYGNLFANSMERGNGGNLLENLNNARTGVLGAERIKSEWGKENGNSSLIADLKEFLMELRRQTLSADTSLNDKDVICNAIDHLLHEISYGRNADPDILLKYTEIIYIKMDSFVRFFSPYILSCGEEFKNRITQLISFFEAGKTNKPGESGNTVQ